MRAALLTLLAVSSVGHAETVRDNFVDRLYSNNDGTVNWSGDWVEVDGQGGGPTGGNVWISNNSDELRLDDARGLHRYRWPRFGLQELQHTAVCLGEYADSLSRY